MELVLVVEEPRHKELIIQQMVQPQAAQELQTQ
jgi:hypothetical protein